MEKSFSIGDKVKYRIAERMFRRNMTEDKFRKDLNEIRNHFFNEIFTFDDFIEEKKKLEAKTFIRDKFKYKKGISVIKSIDDIDESIFVYTLENDMVAKQDELTIIPFNDKIADILKKCTVVPSLTTKTGKYYIYGNEFVMEYVVSTNNVWVSNKFETKHIKKYRLDVSKEIRNYLGKNVTVNFDCCESIDKVFHQLNKMVENY